MKVKVTQLCLTVCNPMNYTVHEILQTRILEWVAFPFSRESSQPRDRTQVSCIECGFFTSWATRESLIMIRWENFKECFYCEKQELYTKLLLENWQILLRSLTLEIQIWVMDKEKDGDRNKLIHISFILEQVFRIFVFALWTLISPNPHPNTHTHTLEYISVCYLALLLANTSYLWENTVFLWIGMIYSIYFNGVYFFLYFRKSKVVHKAVKHHRLAVLCADIYFTT